MQAISRRLQGLFNRQAIVKQALALYTPLHQNLSAHDTYKTAAWNEKTCMFQTIPLRARLGVNLNLVIQPKEALLFHFLDVVLNGNAAKAGKLDIVHGPIQLDMAAGLNLPRSLFDSLCIQEIDGYSTRIVTQLLANS